MSDSFKYSIFVDGKYLHIITRDGLCLTSNPNLCIQGTDLEMSLLIDFLESVYDVDFTLCKVK